MFEYFQRRSDAQIAMQDAPPSPCTAGKGRCCDGKVPVATADLNLIESAIASGKISEAIRLQAIANAEDPNRNNTCPFLGNDQLCMIYLYRPLTCMIWGIGGIPRSRGIAEKAVRGQQLLGIETTFEQNEITGLMCGSCAGEVKRRKPRYSMTTIAGIFAGYIFVQDNPAGILKRFVQERLPQLSSPKAT